MAASHRAAPPPADDTSSRGYFFVVSRRHRWVPRRSCCSRRRTRRREIHLCLGQVSRRVLGILVFVGFCFRFTLSLSNFSRRQRGDGAESLSGWDSATMNRSSTSRRLAYSAAAGHNILIRARFITFFLSFPKERGVTLQRPCCLPSKNFSW